jgi:cytochrome c oxidase cbb3-type subunit 4
MIIVRSAVTVTLFVLFIVLWIWAWSDRRRDEFAAAAMLPFDDTDDVAPANATQEHPEKA